MRKLFISYRREDSATVAHIIFKELKRCFGAESVFIDVDTMPPGVDFRKHLSGAVSQCDVLLAVIGTHWLDSRNQNGSRRLDDPGDFLRIEIEAALSRGIPVIPVLVEQQPMPRKHELPDALAELAFRHAAEIRPGRDFNNDLERLIQMLRRDLNVRSVGGLLNASQMKVRGVAAAILVALMLLVGTWTWMPAAGKPKKASDGSQTDPTLPGAPSMTAPAPAAPTAPPAATEEEAPAPAPPAAEPEA